MRKNIDINIILFFTLVMLLIGLFSCMTPKKAVDYLKKKNLLADTCSENYPVKDSLIKGDTITTTDTLWGIDVTTDTLIKNDTVYITKVLPGKVIIKTKVVYDTIIRRDIAQETVLKEQRNKLAQEKADMTIERDRWKEDYRKLKARVKGKILIPWYILVILCLLIVLSIKLKMFRLFNPLK